MASTPEGRVKAHVRTALLKLHRCYWFMPVQRGGAPALDYFICIDGRFYAIETKVPGKTLNPRQWVTANTIVAAGGTVLIVRSKADAENIETILRREKAWPDVYAPDIYEFGKFLWGPVQR